MKYQYILFLCYFFFCVYSFPLHLKKKERYIIQLKKPSTTEKLCAQDDSIKTMRHLRQEIKKIFSFGKFEGLVGEFSKDVIERLSNNPLVEKITEDYSIQALDDAIQYDSPNHLVRISQDGPVQDEQNREYVYSSQYLGQDVTAYVIDTGVFVAHSEFEGRAYLGPNFSDDFRNVDYVGHGTHVAGIIGSKTYGVAKKVRIHSVKVLDRFGQGTLSSVISGLEYAVNHRLENGGQAVANLSLGASKSSVLDAAVKAAFDSGMIVVVAAGNNNLDACRTSPAGSPYAITVGAINDVNDNIAHFSNWGECVDIFSSGVDVKSLSNNQYDDSLVLSGTSMASPIVAGLVGNLYNKGFLTKDIMDELKKMSIKDSIPQQSVSSKPGSPNKIANNGIRDERSGDFYKTSKTLNGTSIIAQE